MLMLSWGPSGKDNYGNYLKGSVVAVPSFKENHDLVLTQDCLFSLLVMVWQGSKGNGRH